MKNEHTAGEDFCRVLPGIIWDYLKDRKAWIGLFFASSLMYVIVCSLYQMDNLPRLLYAFLLSSFICLCYGIMDLRRYLKKRRIIRMAYEHLEQAEILLASGRIPRMTGAEGLAETDPPPMGRSMLEKAYEDLIMALCREHSRFQSEEERRESERNDYYLMWAHQIKTPIAAIKLLLNGRDDAFRLMEELFKIEQYVEMVLHYLRLESLSSDLMVREYELYQIVKQAVKKYSVLFINSGLSLRLEEFHETVLTDEKWLSFVLEQLLSNSIKYTKKGQIAIYMQPDQDKTLVLEDTGIGIKAEDLPRIFERGFTGYNGRMDKKSTGIGLYLCRQVCDRLSHGIRVESQEGRGTRVFLDLSRESYHME